MKRYLVTIACTCLGLAATAQSIPNAAMENWDASFYPEYPANWVLNAHFVSMPCTPSALSAFKTSDAYSGKWAAKLQSVNCWDDMGVEQTYIGLLAAGDINDFGQLVYHGIATHRRPERLKFYYKYKCVGNDTAMARISLLKLDSIGYIKTVIGEGTAIFTKDVNQYTLQDIPVKYLSAETPDVMQIVFANHKGLAETWYQNAPANTLAHEGTTLWVDEIAVSGEALGVAEAKSNELFQLYPTPAGDHITIMAGRDITNYAIEVYDMLGKIVSRSTHKDQKEVRINTANWNAGMYLIKTYDLNGQLLGVNKAIILH